VRLALVTAGSRGDVQPLVALTLGLRRAGHEVRLVTFAGFRDLAAGYGVDIRPLSGDVREVAETPEVKELFRVRNPLRLWSRLVELAAPRAATFIAEVLAACEGVDAVGLSGLAFFLADGVAEKLGVPLFGAGLGPMCPSRRVQSHLLPPWLGRLPGGAALSHRLATWILMTAFGGLANRTRREVLALPPRKRGVLRRPSWSAMPLVLGYSPCVLPRPGDWPERVAVTGYWFLDEPAGWEPPPQLVDFLATGPPPVCVGFGSMTTRTPEVDGQVAVEALARTGQRGVLLTGWAGLLRRSLPETVIAVESAPHSWLFPRCAAVVHHGGAGTTGAALRAGVPSVVVPFAFDQPFWGDRVRALGCGPAPVPHRRLSVRRLVPAVGAALHPATAARARSLGARIRAEDGPTRAAEFLAGVGLGRTSANYSR
jgi:UDP:flavonoid glycosyltransferase YjiC (YdhE family)